jgi:hypothetical protein
VEKMKILYTNKYVEIKACTEKKFLDIKQKQKIQDERAMDRLSQNIKYFIDITKYNSILFSINETDFSSDYNFFQDEYFTEIYRSGMKNLILIIKDDEKRSTYQHKLQDFSTNSGLHVEFFKDIYSATEWITLQPNEIPVYL